MDPGNPGDPSIQRMSTLDPKVYKYYLHWAIWTPRVIIQNLSLSGGSSRETSPALETTRPWAQSSFVLNPSGRILSTDKVRGSYPKWAYNYNYSTCNFTHIYP